MDSIIPQQQLAEKLEKHIQTRLHRILCLRFCLETLAMWGFIWGTAVLIGRVGCGWVDFPTGYGLVLVIPILIRAWIQAQKKAPSVQAIRGWLDTKNHCGGLLMASLEADLGKWWPSIPVLAEPSIKWKKKRYWGMFLAASLFAVGSGFVPVQAPGYSGKKNLDLAEETKTLGEQIKALEEEALISKEKAQLLEKELEQISKNASGEDPAKTLEAMDHLEQVVQKSATEAAEKMAAQNDKLRQAEKLAERMTAADKGSFSEAMKTEAMKELANALKQAMAGGGLERSSIDDQLLKDLAGGGADQKELKKLLDQLGQSKEMISVKIDSLKKVKLIDPSQVDLKNLKEAKEGEESDSDVYMKCDGKDGKPGDKMLLIPTADGPGNGGISRGRGDAGLQYSGKTDDLGVKFKEEILPPSDLNAFRKAQSIGTAIAAPNLDSSNVAPVGGALAGAQSGGGNAFSQRILPRYRSTVKRYFMRK